MKKIILSLTLLIGISYTALTGYAITQMTITELVICANENKAFYIPQMSCRAYLFKFRGTPDDIQDLKQHTGLDFVLGVSDKENRDKMIRFFIGKGMDINDRVDRHGNTAMHNAVLTNNAEHVEYLLSLGADPLATETDYNLNVYDYLDFIEKKSEGKNIDRNAVRELLLHFKNTVSSKSLEENRSRTPTH